MEFNPYRKPGNAVTVNAPAAKGFIETPDDCRYNMEWQTRDAEPGEYQIRLSVILHRLFEQGQHALTEIVTGLAESDVRLPSGEAWTETTFRAEMERLGKL